MGFNSGGRSWSELERALSGKVEAPPGDGGDGPAWSRHREGYAGAPPDLVERHDRDDACLGLPRVPYAELHVHSNFSFLDGASHPEQLVEEAARARLDAIALTDHDGMYGVVRFADAARELGMRTVYGAELSLGLTAPQNGVADPQGPAPAGPGPRGRGLPADVPGDLQRPPARRGEGQAGLRPGGDRRRTARARAWC